MRSVLTTRFLAGVVRPGVVVLAMVTASCAPDADRGALTGRAESDASTVTILDPSFETIFNPSWSMSARFLVYSPLMTTGQDGQLEPRLAKSWEHSADYREWTYHLRTDVLWHDGVPFTARDVAFTIGMMGHPEVAYLARPDTVIVANDSTVTIRRTRPWDGRNTWYMVYPEHLLGDVEPADFFASEFWTQPVGTGPFRYVRHVPKTVFVLEANPNYFGGKPRIARVQIKFGGGSPLVELRSGAVDAATYVSRSNIPLFQDDPRFQVYHRIYPEVTGLETLVWNHRHPFLGDAGVRRALTLAIDRKELRQLLNVPEDLPVFDVLFSPRQFWDGKIPAPLPHDPEEARALLDSAGWRDTDGDGVRQRDGLDARFTLLVSSGAAGATKAWVQTGVYVQAALRRIGVHLEIQTTEAPVPPMVRSGNFEAAFMTFNQWEDPTRRWGMDSPWGYHDPHLSRILGALDTLFDATVRDDLYRETWPFLQRDIPVTFLSINLAHFVVHRRVRGLISPFGADPYANLEHAWIEEPER